MFKLWPGVDKQSRIEINRDLSSAIEHGVTSQEDLVLILLGTCPQIVQPVSCISEWCAEFGVGVIDGGDKMVMGLQPIGLLPEAKGYFRFNWEGAEAGLHIALKSKTMKTVGHLEYFAKNVGLRLDWETARRWLKANGYFKNLEGRYVRSSDLPTCPHCGK